MIDAAATTIAGIQTIAEVIRLAVAPVFLLSGVGIMLTVLTNRLARAVDRARVLEGRSAQAPHEPVDGDVLRQLRVLAKRARLLSAAITLLTVCALLVSMVVVMLFMAAFFDFGVVRTIAVLFIAAMIAFVIALLYFLREIFIATAAIRVGIRR